MQNGHIQHTYVLKVQVEEEANGRWNAMVPDLPGLIYSADSRTEAMQGLGPTAESYLKSLESEGRTHKPFSGSQIFQSTPLLVVTI